MKRSELLNNKEWWLANIQNDLYAMIYEYMHRNGLNSTKLAEQLGFTKGYLSQVLKGDYDHKLSKMVELSLACGAAPLLYFVDLKKYIADDESDKEYQIFPVFKPKEATYVITTDNAIPNKKLEIGSIHFTQQSVDKIAC